MIHSEVWEELWEPAEACQGNVLKQLKSPLLLATVGRRLKGLLLLATVGRQESHTYATLIPLLHRRVQEARRDENEGDVTNILDDLVVSLLMCGT